MAQCSGQSLLVALIILCSWLAFACGVAALFSPAWVIFSDTSVQFDCGNSFLLGIGLFLDCGCNIAQCQFHGASSVVNVLGLPSSSEKYILAGQILWPISTALLLYCSIAAVSYCACLCRKSCQCFKSTRWSISLTAFCFLAFSASMVVVVAFSVKASHSVWGGFGGNMYDRGLPIHFDWGMYLAICTSCLSLVTFIFMIIATCCMSSVAPSPGPALPYTAYTTSVPYSESSSPYTNSQYDYRVPSYLPSTQPTAPPSYQSSVPTYNEPSIMWPSSENYKSSKEISGYNYYM